MAGEAGEPLNDGAPSGEASVYDDVLATMAELQARPAPESSDVEDADEAPVASDDEPDEPGIEAAADEDDDEPEPKAKPADDPVSRSVERWAPVMESLGIEREKLVDNYMSAVVALHQDPVSTIAQLAKTYLPADQAQTMLAALAAEFQVDPFEVDVDAYKQSQPMSESNRQIQQLQAQLMQLRVEQMAAKPEYPLLKDGTVQRDIARTMARYTDLSIEDAYAFVVHRNPDLSSKHQRAVSGRRDAGGKSDEVRRDKLRRAVKADLPRGSAGSPGAPVNGGSVYDDVRAVAAEIGFGRS